MVMDRIDGYFDVLTLLLLPGLSMGPWDMFALPVAGLENLVQSSIAWYFKAFVAVSPVT